MVFWDYVIFCKYLISFWCRTQDSSGKQYYLPVHLFYLAVYFVSWKAKRCENSQISATVAQILKGLGSSPLYNVRYGAWFRIERKGLGPMLHYLQNVCVAFCCISRHLLSKKGKMKNYNDKFQ